MSDYCVGNCLEWDEGTGRLTIATDPLGGTICGPDGLKLRIAGDTTGVAVATKNNGLFMDVTGNVATKVTPTRRLVSSTTGATTVNSYLNGLGYGPWAGSSLTITNPSTVYPMMATVVTTFGWDFQLFAATGNGGGLVFTCQTGDAGVYTTREQPKWDQFNAGHMTHRGNIKNHRYVEIAAGASLTVNARMYVDGTGANFPYLYSVNSGISAHGLIMEVV